MVNDHDSPDVQGLMPHYVLVVKRTTAWFTNPEIANLRFIFLLILEYSWPKPRVLDMKTKAFFYIQIFCIEGILSRHGLVSKL